MYLNAQDLLLAGVLAQLAFSLAHRLFRAPKQQAQIDAIESKVDAVLGQLSTTAK